MKNKNLVLVIVAVLFLLLCCVTVVVGSVFAYLRVTPQSSQFFNDGIEPDNLLNDLPVQVSPDDSYENQQTIFVDDLKINLMESFPIQVSATVVGNLPDGCTRIVDSRAELIDESTFELRIITERPEDMMCTMALVPFEEHIILDVEGLPAGTYTVKGFGLENSFTLDVDNK
jgi:inhibitor of cysteine peptidase